MPFEPLHAFLCLWNHLIQRKGKLAIENGFKSLCSGGAPLEAKRHGGWPFASGRETEIKTDYPNAPLLLAQLRGQMLRSQASGDSCIYIDGTHASPCHEIGPHIFLAHAHERMHVYSTHLASHESPRMQMLDRIRMWRLSRPLRVAPPPDQSRLTSILSTTVTPVLAPMEC